jgi:hypothetical protein
MHDLFGAAMAQRDGVVIRHQPNAMDQVIGGHQNNESYKDRDNEFFHGRFSSRSDLAHGTTVEENPRGVDVMAPLGGA